MDAFRSAEKNDMLMLFVYPESTSSISGHLTLPASNLQAKVFSAARTCRSPPRTRKVVRDLAHT